MALRFGAAAASIAIFALSAEVPFAPGAGGLTEPVIVYPDGTDLPARLLFLRPGIDLESPFLPLGEESLVFERAVQGDGARQRIEFVPFVSGHSGFLLDAAVLLDAPPLSSLQLDDRLGGLVSSPSQRARVLPVGAPWSAVLRDPYAGTIFAGRAAGSTVTLEVIAPDGALLAQIRHDLFSAAPLADLRSAPWASTVQARRNAPGPGPPDALELGTANAQPPAYYWFANERLAGAPRAFARIGRSDYARYLVHAFVLRVLTGDDDLRLPFLPDTASAAGFLQGALGSSNLGRLETVTAQEHGRLCTVFPILKILEDRDCAPGAACPRYSAMSAFTALLRLKAGDEEERVRVASRFVDVVEALARDGLCEEALFPYLPDSARGRRVSGEELSRRSAAQLQVAVAGQDPRFAPLVQTLDPPGELRFIDGLPAACRDAAQRFRERSPVRREDFLAPVGIAVLSDLRALSPEARREIVEAQREELTLLLARLLGQGALVGVLGIEGVLDHHGVLAYGAASDGVLVMDSAIRDEAGRRRRVIPWRELRATIAALAVLRARSPAWRDSEPQYRRALATHPDDAWTLFSLAGIWLESGRVSEAVGLLQRAVASSPDYAAAWELLGSALSAMGRYDEAEAALRRSFEKGYERSFGRLQLGMIRFAQRRFADGERELRRALELDPSNPEAWTWLGTLLDETGRTDEAEESLRKALDVAPGRGEQASRLGDLLVEHGRTEQAREVLEAFLERHPTGSGRERVAARLASAGSPEAALAALEAQLAAEPDRPEVRLELARVLRARGRGGEAADLLEPLVAAAQDPTATEVHDLLRLAYVHALAGRSEPARTALAAAIAAAGTPAGSGLYNAACVLALIGDADGALVQLERALGAGYKNLPWIRRDPDLGALAGRSRFRELTARPEAPH